MVTVVIAAHDEATVIGGCLDTLLADALPGELQVVVAANGCTDDTAGVARAREGVVVVEVPRPGKVGALNAAEEVATGFPRLYLDADIAVTTDAVRRLAGALADPAGPLVATPDRRLDVTGRPLAVRAWAAVHRRLPVFDDGLVGRGLVAVSEAGRARWDRFPDVVADDLFLDGLFTASERVRVREVSTLVATPRRTRDLVRRLARVRRGNAALRAGATTARAADRWSWLRDVVLPRPWLAPAGAVYVVLTTWAALLARRVPAPGAEWGRDESTRVAAPPVRDAGR